MFENGLRLPASHEDRFDDLATRVPWSPVVWRDDFPQESAVLWTRFKGGKGVELLRRFPAQPSLVVKKGVSVTALWSVWPELRPAWYGDYNERLARFFGGRLKDVAVKDFKVDLREGEVFLLNNLTTAENVAGRL
jgi:hypothetical protein